MLIMKSADWLRVARPILLLCISLADIGVTLYQKVGYHLSLPLSPSSSFFLPFSFPPLSFPLPWLPLPPFVFFPLPSHFPYPSPQIQLRGLGALWMTHMLVEVVIGLITPLSPDILWQVVSQSYIFHQLVTFLYVTAWLRVQSLFSFV